MKAINKNWYRRFKALMNMMLTSNGIIFALVFILLNGFFISMSLTSKVRAEEGTMFLSIVFLTIK